MLFVANYAMKGRVQALFATMLLAVLTVWIAPVGLLLGAVIALVTLRVGAIDGFKTLAVAMVTILSLTVILSGSMLPAVVAIVEFILPIWIISLVLRQTNLLASAIHVSILMAGIAVVVFHLLVGDTTLWWKLLFESTFLPAITEAGVEIPAQTIENITKVATLVLAMFAVFLWVSIILIARWWQSQLYYPGKFREDFYQIRLPKNVAYLAIVVIVASLLSDSVLMQDLSAVLIAGLIFPGLAITHHAFAKRDLSSIWLVGFYFLLFLFPQTILIVAAMGLIDTWLDIRNRWTQS